MAQVAVAFKAEEPLAAATSLTHGCDSELDGKGQLLAEEHTNKLLPPHLPLLAGSPANGAAVTASPPRTLA